MDKKIAAGFIEAKNITGKFAKTFYFASHFLCKEKRLAAYSVYAICRISDEAVDKPGGDSETNTLTALKEDINSAYGAGELRNNLLLAFRKTVNEYKIPKAYFDELIEGMRMDLNKNRYNNFEELYTYCYRAAGVVGLIMLKIFGYTNPEAEKYAVNLGIAMQLTNILRDIKEDYSRGRIYLPQEEMKRFGVPEEDIASENASSGFRELLKFQINRAREYYAGSAEGIKLINNINCRFVTLAMKELYAGILNSIENNDYDVFSRRAHVNLTGKLITAAKILIGRRYL